MLNALILLYSIGFRLPIIEIFEGNDSTRYALQFRILILFLCTYKKAIDAGSDL